MIRESGFRKTIVPNRLTAGLRVFVKDRDRGGSTGASPALRFLALWAAKHAFSLFEIAKLKFCNFL